MVLGLGGLVNPFGLGGASRSFCPLIAAGCLIARTALIILSKTFIVPPMRRYKYCTRLLLATLFEASDRSRIWGCSKSNRSGTS